MSLGIAFKGPEGIVLAADSRVTLTYTSPGNNDQVVIQHSTFDNAEKLLRVKGQDFVGAITYGAGAIGSREPRTANSYLPEFEEELGDARLSVPDFSKALSDFFMKQWKEAKMSPEANPMVFLVGGYDEGDAHGRVFEVGVPNLPEPKEHFEGHFGARWGGQFELTNRVIHGFDPRLPTAVQDLLGISENERDPELAQKLQNQLQLAIPWQFLPLQDCVDLSIFLVQMTISLQKWMVGLRGVGGVVDVATITRTEGFRAVQKKKVTGSN